MWFEYNNRQISLGRDEYAANMLSSSQDLSRQELEFTIGYMDMLDLGDCVLDGIEDRITMGCSEHTVVTLCADAPTLFSMTFSLFKK